MHALVDCDILCYEMGSARDQDGYPLDWPLVRARLETRINGIIRDTEATFWTPFLTSQDKSNFRFKVATIRPYKEHRQKLEKPYWYHGVYNYLENYRNAVVIEDMEADDAMSIVQWKNLSDAKRNGTQPDTIICTRDKDLKMVPGWHYQWPSYKQEEQRPYWINPIDGLRFFYSQLIMGDDADNIPGLYGMGANSKHIKRLDDCQTELEMFEIVRDLYEKYFGSYWPHFLRENGRLLWMLRSEDDEWDFPPEWQNRNSKNVDETNL